MVPTAGKYLQKKGISAKRVSAWLIPASFFLIELFAFVFLKTTVQEQAQNLSSQLSSGEETSALFAWWPLVFGGVWTILLTGLISALPGKLARIAYGISYFLFLIYAFIQTGYYLLFQGMIWISDFRYASEGADYLDVLLSYPVSWWICLPVMIGIGVFTLWNFPKIQKYWKNQLLSAGIAVMAAVGAWLLPQLVFLSDSSIRYAESDYGRAQSAEAAYENMFDAHRLYQVCGIYQTAVKDVYTNYLYPITPAYAQAQQKAEKTLDAFFDTQEEGKDNAMTGLLQGKNVVLVLMESMDDWMIGEHTPTIARLMSEGMNFTKFYTPGYGGIRTFNTEFCINTGSFLSSSGGYAFDYVTNHFDQSLANMLRDQGYSAKVYHYNDPSFYSRGVFSPAMGYEEYISYQDYVTEQTKDQLYDDQFLFDNQQLSDSFFREGQKLNFIITRSAHLSYKYNEVLSYWGLKKYPQYRNLTDNEETNCAYLKAKLVDDMFARLLEELESHGELENTVIVAVTDHYTYGYKNESALLELSGVQQKLLLERTPCFIWTLGMEPMEVDKVLNTSDLLPTLLNLLGIHSEYSYIGSDAFDEDYEGFVPFANGSWICGDTAYDASTGKYFSVSGEELTDTPEFRRSVAQKVQQFIRVNNLILETDYYQEKEEELSE